MKHTLSFLFLIISISVVTAQDSLTVKKERLSQFRVAADVGLSNRFVSLDNVEPVLEFFYNDLKVGSYTQLSVDYGQLNKMNIGLVYNHFGANKTLPSVSFVDTLSNVSEGILREEIDLTSILLRISGRRYLGKGENVMLLSSLGVGITSYSQITTKAESVVTQKGQSLTLAASLGVDVFILKNLALGGEVKFWYGGLSKVEKDDGILVTEVELNEAEKINLSKLEVGIGCRYYF